MEIPLGQGLRELSGPVLLTGHTGFKGTWMTFLLERLKVPVIGYSLPAEKDSLYDRSDRLGAIPEMLGDIRDYTKLESFIDQHKPSAVIHMAAQPLVLRSYESPLETFDVNVMGTANILDIAFKKDFIKCILVVTTDKVYRNENTGKPFKESDPLEGKDPYSASKVGTEATVKAWQQIALVDTGPRVISVRAGNVIGGGDFATDRLVPDIIKAIIAGTEVTIRNPSSYRPWQHVLDPLIGYLLAMENSSNDLRYENYNFGPSEKPITVFEVVKIAHEIFPSMIVNIQESDIGVSGGGREATALALDSSLSKNQFNWEPVFTQEKAIKSTFQWWKMWLENQEGSAELCKNEIEQFLPTNSS
jgi:CDP-glucose 4,6-dehydratase